MRTELNYQLSQDGVVSFGRAKKGGLSQLPQATRTDESKSLLTRTKRGHFVNQEGLFLANNYIFIREM